nr:MAG TPA: minor capsid component [Caudoviricetes sp.]
MTPNMLREKPIRKAIEVSARGYTTKVDPIIRDLSNSTQRALKQDLHTFAGFKTYHHLQEVAGRSRNADGTLKSWQEFVADTAKIDDKYNKTWLKAEYAFVQASAQMAAKWERFAQWGDAYDLLYKTAGDEKVRADHARLNGMCLPFSDPAWDTCFPPNGWGCRCDVIQVIPGTHPRSQSEEVVDIMEEMTPGKQEIFRFNPGKEGRLIPPKYPYYGKNGNKEREAIERNINSSNKTDSKYAEEEAQARKLLEETPKRDDGTKYIKFGEGGVTINPGIQKDERFKNLYTAGWLAERYGHEIILYKATGDGHSEDSRNITEDRLVEYKHIESNAKNAFDKNIQTGAKQADHIVIVIRGDYAKGDLIAAIKSRVTRSKNLKTVRVIEDYKRDIEITREQVLNDKIPL